MNGDCVVTKCLDRRKHLLVDLAGKEHDKCKALFFAVILNYQLVEITNIHIMLRSTRLLLHFKRPSSGWFTRLGHCAFT